MGFVLLKVANESEGSGMKKRIMSMDVPTTPEKSALKNREGKKGQKKEATKC